MLRKKSAIVFILIAQLFILGHSAIAHIHPEDLFVSHHSHGNDHGHYHLPAEENNNPLEKAFSDFVHIGEQAIFTNPELSKQTASELLNVRYESILATPISFDRPSSTYLPHKFPPDKRCNYKTYFYKSQSLRGPPNFIVA